MRRFFSAAIAILLAATLTPALNAPMASAADQASATSFVDVPATNQFFTEITWLADRGVTTGYPDGSFHPLQPVKRDAMAAFLYRYAGSPEVADQAASPFVDISSSTQFYKEMSWLAQKGISTGWEAGNGCRVFKPMEPVKRDAMAAFMYRLTEGGDTPITGGGCNANPNPNPNPGEGTVQSGVHFGSFCAPEGATGTTVQGITATCKKYPGEPRARWRR